MPVYRQSAVTVVAFACLRNVGLNYCLYGLKKMEKHKHHLLKGGFGLKFKLRSFLLSGKSDYNVVDKHICCVVKEEMSLKKILYQ